MVGTRPVPTTCKHATANVHAEFLLQEDTSILSNLAGIAIREFKAALMLDAVSSGLAYHGDEGINQ